MDLSEAVIFNLLLLWSCIIAFVRLVKPDLFLALRCCLPCKLHLHCAAAGVYVCRQ